jgi:hypothetical protein
MHSIVVALVVLVCTFGGALFGMVVGPRLPAPHVSKETKRVVDLGMGVLATLSGLVLGLLVSTSKTAFDTTENEVKEISAKLVLLDHVLARYGAETIPVRARIRGYVERKIEEVWSAHAARTSRIETAAGADLESALDGLNALSPTTEAQRGLKARALTIAGDIAQARWLLIEGNVGSVIPRAFLAIVVFWLTILFVSYGLFAPRNAVSIIAIFVCALSMATALFLVMELSQPFAGIIHIPSAAARNALANMGR